jgi:hypothetical protein
MSNLLNIYNENFGYQVATNGTYVAVGNPNSKPYTCQEGYARLGEVVLYRKNQFNTNYSLAKKYRKTATADVGFFNTYYTEQSSSGIFTSSLITEQSGSVYGESADRAFNSCSFYILESGNTITMQNGYGRSVALCEKYMAIGDMAFSESIANVTQSFASVDVYQITDTSTSSGCDNSDPATFTLPSIPFCTITGAAYEQFGKAVAISNKFLLIGAPTALSGKGRVYVYEKTESGGCGYSYHSTLTCGNGVGDKGQKLFGSAVSVDKISQKKIAVGTLSTTQSRVYVYELSSDENSWTRIQTLEQNTSSVWLNTSADGFVQFSASFPQTASAYGYSVAITENALVVGAPHDLIYQEYSGSGINHQRGAFYFYYQSSGSHQYVLQKKFYGDTNTLKDNMLGYSVDVTDRYILVGSPKPYFPFSSLYLSSSVYKFNTNFETNDFGASTFNGQALLYKWKANPCSGSALFELATTSPIGYRKRIGESFSGFGASVAVSNDNLVVGSPAILDDDLYLAAPILAEQSGSVPVVCDDPDPDPDVVELLMEDSICDCEGNTVDVAYVFEQPVVDEIQGRAFIYNFSDLQANAVVGNIFYNNDRMVINNTGSILKDLLRSPLNPLQGYVYGTYDSEVTLNEKQYICTVEPGEFNVSTNPTAITGSAFSYGIINKATFDFSNLDIILRYINYKLTIPHQESWWNVLVEGDVQQSMFGFFSSSVYNYNQNRLTPDLRCGLSTKDFDVNKDGIVDYADAFLIWNYYIENLQVTNYKQYLSPISRRQNYDDIIRFLDVNTGKGTGDDIKPDFFSYHLSASMDPTGSYLAPYITQVGLYAGADLVAVGKIANPIKNTGQIPVNIVVKWDT